MKPETKLHEVNALEHLAMALKDSQQRIELLLQEIVELELAGMVDASEWWKGGKYLYLVHPTTPDGRRLREYVGSDPAAVEAARARMARYKRWIALKASVKELREKDQKARMSIDHALWLLNSVQRSLWGEE